MSLWKQVLVLFVIAALGYGSYYVYERSQAAQADEKADAPRRDRASIVETQDSETRNIAEVIEAVGSTRALRSVEIVPENGGRITELSISPGQAVAKGDILVRLDDEIARADFTEAGARLADRKRVLERVTQLRATRSVAESAVEEATLALAEAQADLERAQKRLNERTLTAPFGGIPGLTNVDPGAYVNAGTVIARLDDLSAVELEFALPETLYARTAPGQMIEALSSAYPGRSFLGEIQVRDMRVDPVSRSFRARAIIPNADGALPAGMFMSVRLTLAEQEAVVVPEEAILFQAAQRYVFVVEDGIARRLAVTTGVRQDGFIVIREGLEAGRQVVVRGMDRIRDGSRVEVPDAALEGSKS